MKKILFILLGLVILGGCTKPVLYDNPLALSDVRNELSAAEGSTPVIVFTNDDWTAYLPGNCDWATLDKATGTGRGEFIFNYNENYGAARKVAVTVVSGQYKTSIDMVQRSGVEELILNFPYSSIKVAKVSGNATVPFTTNIYESEMSKVKVSATNQNGTAADWIKTLTVFPDRLCFALDVNESGESRKAVIKFDYTDDFGAQLVKSITVEQTCDEPYLEFNQSALQTMYSSRATKVKLPFETNLGLYLSQIVGNATSSQSWANIDAKSSLSPELVIDIDANEGAARLARIQTYFVDNEGIRSDFECILVQKAYVKQVTMSELKATIPSQEGEFVYAGEGMLEAYVISDCRNANVETNPNLKTNDVDFTLNWRTAYLQTEDGTSGLRVVFEKSTDNILSRGDKVYVDLSGLTLVKEANPTRYTLSGLKSSSVSVDEQNAQIVVRSKKIGELTDDDLYTAVSLKGVEFTFKHGAYTNTHDGYQRQLKLPDYPNVKGKSINPNGAGAGYYFSDCTPCSLRDAEGNSIYALINNETPWRRYGNGVPQGTCDIECIVTHTDLARWSYKGWLGRYQIRILNESDIAAKGDAFSKTVIEWNWGETAAKLGREDALKPTSAVHPSAFSVTSNLDGVKSAQFNGGCTSNMCDFNNLVNDASGTNTKGYIDNGSVYWYRKGYFWASDDPSDLSAAPWFCFAFSTAGLTGTSMSFNWTAAVGAGWSGASDIYAPSLWKVEYSTDGSQFTTINETYAIHPIVRYNTACAAYAINGLHMYTTALPADLLGRDKVYVRIRAISNASSSEDGLSEDGGKIKTGDNMLRFGEIAVEYN